MARPVQPERVFLVLQLLDFGPRRRRGGRGRAGRPRSVVVAAEQLRLAEIVVALSTRPVLTRRINRREQPGSRFARWYVRVQTVARAGLHQRLEHALVRDAKVD